MVTDALSARETRMRERNGAREARLRKKGWATTRERPKHAARLGPRHGGLGGRSPRPGRSWRPNAGPSAGKDAALTLKELN